MNLFVGVVFHGLFMLVKVNAVLATSATTPAAFHTSIYVLPVITVLRGAPYPLNVHRVLLQVAPKIALSWIVRTALQAAFAKVELLPCVLGFCLLYCCQY